MYTHTTQVRVRYAETDQMGVVYHGNYAAFCEVGRVESIRALEYSYKQMEADGVIMPIVALNFKFIRPAKYDDLLTIESSITDLPTAHEVQFTQKIYNEGKVLLVIATVRLYFLDAVTMQRVNSPQHLLNKLAPFYA